MEIENRKVSTATEPGEDSALISRAKKLDLRHSRADSVSTATIVIITITAAITLVFLLIWAFTKAHWLMIGMLICGGLLLVLTVVLLVSYPIALIFGSMVRKAALKAGLDN